MKLKLRRTELEITYALLCAAAASVISGLYVCFLYTAAAVAVHESGHLAAMLRYGYFPKRIKLSLFSIEIIDGGRQTRIDRENFFIIFFGPAANFICSLSCFLLSLKLGRIFLPFAWAQLFVGAFNSLPVLSLDGGMILYMLLLRRFDSQTAERLVNVCTLVLLVPLAAAGFILLFKSKNNFSLLLICAYLILSLILRKGYF